MPERASDPRRRTFLPVVLLGLASSGLAAVAGHQRMMRFPEDAIEDLGLATFNQDWYADYTQVEFPLAGALALVALACWGVLLVTRGWARRAAAGLATVSSVGVLLVLVFGGFVEDDEAAKDLMEQIGSPSLAEENADLAHTAWFWLALLCAVVAIAAGVLALRLAPSWPAMGARYDAPGAAESVAASRPAEEQSNLELWKSLDEGTDPTSDRPTP